MPDLYVTIRARVIELSDNRFPGDGWRNYGYSFGDGSVWIRNPERLPLRHDAILNAIANEALARGMNLSTDVRRQSEEAHRKVKERERQLKLF